MKRRLLRWRIPQWLMEAPFLYTISIVCVLYSATRIAVAFQHQPLPPGSVELLYPSWLVWTWVTFLGAGGICTIIARPWYLLRLEAAGLTMLAAGLFLLCIAVGALFPMGLLSATLYLALTFGVLVQLRITMLAMKARRHGRHRGGS